VIVEQLRARGLSMGTVYPSFTSAPDEETGEVATTRRYRGWTTDETKATAARDLGASAVRYESTDPRFSGWEINAVVVES
jgi:hypothetical protein